MKKMLKTVLPLILCLPLLLGLLCGCERAGGAEFTANSDFAEARIGIMQGSVYDDYAKELFPNAERKYYNTLTDLTLALKQGKIDGFIAENTLSLLLARRAAEDITYRREDGAEQQNVIEARILSGT